LSSLRRHRIATTASLFCCLCGLALASSAKAQTRLVGQLGEERPRISGPLSLDKAVETGLRNNLEVLAMEAEARAAKEETAMARAMSRPQISANSYAAIGNMQSIVNSSPGPMPPNATLVPPNGFVGQNISLMAPLYTGGRLGSLVGAASQKARAADQDARAAGLDASLMIKSAYSQVLYAREMARVAEARVLSNTEMARVARAELDAGKGIQAKVSRAEAEVADAQRMLASAKNDEAKMLLDLKRAMGVSLDSEVELSDALALTPPREKLDELIADALKKRPEIAAARARYEASRSTVAAAKGAQRPQVYGGVMADANWSKDMGSAAGITPTITMSIPLFDAGQRRAEVRSAEAMVQRAEAQLRDAELKTSTEVRQAWLDVDTAAQNYTTAQSAVRAAQDAYDVIRVRLEAQRAIQVELLDALATLTQARANVARALFEHSIAVARLMRAAGRN
jgi:outer membrane protein